MKNHQSWTSVCPCPLRVKHQIRDVSRSYLRCLDRSVWLFYHFIRFYDPKCSKKVLWSKPKYYDYDQNMTIVCTLRVKCRTWGDSRPYWRCLARFVWLFYHFIRCYGPKCSKICQSRSWWSKPKYCDYDQSVARVCPLRVNHRIWGVSRSYWRCLDRFLWLCYHFIRCYGPKCSNICQGRSWWSKLKYYDYDQSVTLMCPLRIVYHSQHVFCSCLE